MKTWIKQFMTLVISCGWLAQAQGTFLPTDITGVRMWLDASQTNLTDGTLVHRWEDSSGNNVDAGTTFSRFGNTPTASPTFTNNVIAGRPVLRFDGGDFMYTGDPTGGGYAPGAANLNLSQTNGATATLITVFRRNEASSDNANWAFNSDRVQYHSGIVRSQVSPFTTWISGVPDPVGGFRIDMITFQGSNTVSQFYTNGTLRSSGTVNAHLGENLVLAAKANTSAKSQVDYAEVIAYTRALNAAERNAVDFYLEMKYDIPNAAGGVMLTPTAPGNTITSSGSISQLFTPLDITDTARGSVSLDAGIVAPRLALALDLEDSAGLDVAAVISYLEGLSNNGQFYSVYAGSPFGPDYEITLVFSGNTATTQYFNWDFTSYNGTLQLDQVLAFIPEPSTLLLLLSGAGLLWARRRTR